MSHIGISRRYFMFGTLLTGALPRPTVASLKALGYQSPNEKLNVAGIGAGGQPFGDLRACEPENIVALADVDWKRGEQGFKRWEKAAKYKDFRQMLDKEGKKIDAVVIGTPDHITFPDESGVEQKEPLGTRGKIGKVFMEEKFSISYNQADPRDPRGWTASEFNSRLGLTCE